jgi:hypothetical protein
MQQLLQGYGVSVHMWHDAQFVGIALGSGVIAKAGSTRRTSPEVKTRIETTVNMRHVVQT